MVGKRQNDLEGDLLPRGAAPNATPRVQKRNGQTLFGPQLKRPRASHPSEATSEPSVLQNGASLSISRMTVGMTVLGLVTQADRFGTELILPGGLRAVVATEEFLLEETMRRTTKMDLDDASSTDSSDEEAEVDYIRPAWEVLTVGDILPAAVVDIETNDHGKRAVKVSLKPHLVNVGLNPSRFLSKNFSAYGVIKSVEDHGYVVSFGANIPHVAFLPFEKTNDVGGTRLAPGSPITVITAEDLKLPKKHRTKVSSSVRVFAQRMEVLKTVTEAEGMTYQDLRAGMLLRCRILQEGPAGLSLSALGVFKVDVDASHIPRKADGSWDATPGKHVLVRLLYVDASLKRIGGSLLENFVELLAPRTLPPSWKTGTTLQALRVERVKPGFGLFLRNDQETGEDANEYVNGSGSIEEEKQKEEGEGESKHPNTNTCIPIFAHISRISDSKGVSIDLQYRMNTRIESGARIVSVSKFDGVVNVDLRPSVLSRKALSLDEVEVGAIYDCKILSQTTMGSLMVAVDGDPYLKGIVLPAHISDVPIPTRRLAKNPGFRIGATIKCRALSVRRAKGKVLLTARKSLVSPKYPVLTSYVQAFNALEETKTSAEKSEEIESLVWFTGVTKGVTQRGGLLVEFCDRVVGLVPPSELCVDHAKRASQSEIESLYPVGDTVYVRLLKADPKERKMLLSMSLKERNRGTRRKKAFPLGQRVRARICGVDADLKHFVVVADAMQSQTTGNENLATANENSTQLEAKELSGVKCHLPFGHLSDNSGVAGKLESELRNRLKNLETESARSVEIPEAMVICYREAVAVLTVKPSLISARDSGHLPEAFDDVKLINAKKRGKEKNGRWVLRGYVKALLKSGAIIGFLGECVGFVRNARIADRFISDPSRSLAMHQSVSAIVDSVDEAHSRFSLSMRPSDIGKIGMEADTLSLFRSLEVWRQVLVVPHVENEFQIGGVIDASVNSVSTYGVKYDLKSASQTAVGVAYAVEGTLGSVIVAGSSIDSGSALPPNLRSGSLSSGDPAPRSSERVRVLDVDPLTGIVDVSRDESCVSGGEKKSVITPGSSFGATVLLVKTAYVILAVKRSKSRTAIAYALGPVTRENLLIQPGAEVRCTVINKKQAGTRRNLVLVEWESFRGSGRRDQLRALEKDSELQQTISKLQGSKGIEETDLVGLKIAGKVTRKFRLHAYVGIAPGVVGQVHLTNVSFVTPATLSEVPVGIAPSRISDSYMLPVEGTKIKEAYVAGLRLPRATDAEVSDPLVVEVSLSRERCFTKAPPVGSKVFGFVKRPSSLFASPEQPDLKSDSLNNTIVVIGPTSFMSCAPVDCLFESTVSIREGTPVVCRITGHGEDASTHTRGALSSNGESKGVPFLCLVQSVHPGRGVRVSIPWHARDETAKSLSSGFVDVCDVASDYDETVKIMNKLETGNVVKVHAISTTTDQANEGKQQIWLSMRNPKQSIVEDRLVTKESMETLHDGSNLRGFVKGIGKKGCFVAIGRNITAQVRLCDLSDEFVKDPEKQFPVGKLVSGKVQTHKLSTNDTRISLVLRKRPRKKLKSEPLPSDLKEGSKVRGVVKRVAEYGAVVEIAPRVTALLHKSEADQDRFVQDPQKEWAVGQAVTGIVIKIANGKISLGTKRCYFEASGIEDNCIDELLAENDESKIQALTVTEEDAVQESRSMFLDRKEEQPLNDERVGTPGGDVEVTNENRKEDDLQTGASIPMTDLHQGEWKQDFQDCTMQERKAPPLHITGGFDFVGTTIPEVDDEVDTDYDSETPKEVAHATASPKKSSRSKREKKKLREAAEREIRIREEALANDPDTPETAEDFERLLLGDPNTSVMWIRYMAFCVQLSQLDKARSIAERALETISLAAEEERVNMWCAYVNLEAQFGARNTADVGTGDMHDTRRAAAVFRVFERACERITDVLSFHLRIASALRFGFPHLADEVLQRAMRRFKGFSEVWLAVGQNQFATGEIHSARKTLERALMTVDKRKHVHLISKFAQFEYKYGNAERGRTVFESLIGNLPKRVDLWNIYLDTELGQCLHESKDSQAIDSVRRARQLFERFTSLDLSSKKMKFAFKKWLKFEKTYGTKESADEVKNRARMYVDKSVSATRK